ncbi:hypothetical protein Tco_0386405 [Tanacetum coccineum]
MEPIKPVAKTTTNADGTSTTLIPCPITTKEKVQKKNDMKARRLFSPPNLDLSYSGLEEFQQPKFEGYGPKSSKSVSKDISNKVRESSDAPLVEELVSDDKLEKKTIFPTVAKMEFVRPKQQENPVGKPIKYAKMYRSQSPRVDCNYHQRERVVFGNNYTRVNYNYSAKKAHPSAHRNMVSRAVLMKNGLRSLNTTRPVNTAHPKTTICVTRKMDETLAKNVTSRRAGNHKAKLRYSKIEKSTKAPPQPTPASQRRPLGHTPKRSYHWTS